MQQSALILAARPSLAALASTRLTLWLLALLGASVIALYVADAPSDGALALPLALLAINLGAAIAVHPSFRRHAALLGFHVALLAVVVLAAVGRLTYLEARLELAQDVPFAGDLLDVRKGPLHDGTLGDVAFVHEGFRIAYAPGLRRGRTENTVRWSGRDGRVRRAVIGDHHPLVIDGYRIYTSPNKGYAPTFTWLPADGRPAVRGVVHLPSYPIHALEQAREWSPAPGAGRVWIMLKADAAGIDPEATGEFRVPAEHRIVVREADARHELAPGDRVALRDGTLVYEGLRTWMGYTVRYEPLQSWLLAAALCAALALGLHYWRKFAATPW